MSCSSSALHQKSQKALLYKTGVILFSSVRRTGSKVRGFEDAEEKQAADQPTAVNPVHFLSHTDLEKIINNRFRTNMPFMHQISSSFILLGSTKTPAPR